MKDDISSIAFPRRQTGGAAGGSASGFVDRSIAERRGALDSRSVHSVTWPPAARDTPATSAPAEVVVCPELRRRRQWCAESRNSISGARRAVDVDKSRWCSTICWTVSKALSTLTQKSATVAFFSPFSASVAIFCDSLTFLRQCGQGLSSCSLSEGITSRQKSMTDVVSILFLFVLKLNAEKQDRSSYNRAG